MKSPLTPESRKSNTYDCQGLVLNLAELIELTVKEGFTPTVVVNPNDLSHFIVAVAEYHKRIYWPSLIRMTDDGAIEFCVWPSGRMRLITSTSQPERSLTVPEVLQAVNFQGVAAYGLEYQNLY